MEAYTCGERQTDSREDYQLYDRIWQRVSPELNPYPNIRAEQGAQGTGGPAPQMESPVAPVPLAPPAAGGQSSSAAPAARSLSRVRRLAAAVYLITGEYSRPALPSLAPQALSWPQLLRESYHDEICGRFNYMRAADETLDPCLAGLFRSLGEEAGDQAEELFRELARLMVRGR